MGIYKLCPQSGRSQIRIGQKFRQGNVNIRNYQRWISEIRIGWKAPFSSDKLQMTVYVNNVSVGTLNITAASGDSGTETISGLNIAGNAVIKITGAGKVGIKRQQARHQQHKLEQ